MSEEEKGRCVMEAPPAKAAGAHGAEDVLPLLDRDGILNMDDREIRAINVPEWGGSVRVRTMSGRERDHLEADAQARQGSLEDFRARVAVATVCDAEGGLLFGPEDVEALTVKCAKALNRVFGVAAAMNGLTDADIEELSKNSKSARNGDAGSESPPASV